LRVSAAIKSPRGEYRLCQGRSAMRRHFDSMLLLLRTRKNTVSWKFRR
jgi:hypothetical protein